MSSLDDMPALVHVYPCTGCGRSVEVAAVRCGDCSEQRKELEQLRADVERLRRCPVRGCPGEPHTCEQEMVAAAEGRTDRLILEVSQLTADLNRSRMEEHRLRELVQKVDVHHIRLRDGLREAVGRWAYLAGMEPGFDSREDEERRAELLKLVQP